MVRCTIRLESNDRVYNAGQMLKGIIEMILKEPKKIRGLYFIVNGRAKCSWSEQEKYGKHRHEGSRRLLFEGEEIFMKQRTYLLGTEGASFLEWTTTEVAIGTHRYEFIFPLPEKLPASFEGKHGNIRYSVVAVLDVPLGFDKKFEEKFTIQRKDDLNLQPELGIHCKSEEIKSFCSLFCQSGPFKMEATIPMSGFAPGPGQSISVTVAFDNKSKVDCDRTKISLNRIIRYNSTTPHQNTKIKAEKIINVLGQGISAGSSTTFTQELEIPQELLSSNDKYCNAVQITYELNVEGKMKGCHRNVEILFPITIGSVAISSDQTKTDQARTASHIDNFKTAPSAAQLIDSVEDRIFGPKITQQEVFIISSPVDFFISRFAGPTAPMDENELPPERRINRW